MTGKFHRTDLEAAPLERLLADHGIAAEPIDHMPFWWAGVDEDDFNWKTAGLRSFLAISEPRYEAVRLEENRATFGLLDQQSRALVVARHDGLVSYGSTGPRDHLLLALKAWVDRGMPGLSTLDLVVYPAERTLTPKPGEWLVRRSESQFLWSLPGGKSL